MPHPKPKPSEIASEAKKIYIPWCDVNRQDLPAVSYLCHSDSMLVDSAPRDGMKHPRFAFYDRDPVDVALDWADAESHKIPVIVPANEKRPGGDWEAGAMGLEECLCRRSNLISKNNQTLAKLSGRSASRSSDFFRLGRKKRTITSTGSEQGTHYPIPEKAGIYSPNVIVFRGGIEKYEILPEIKDLPVISVCPVKRPKLDSSGKRYSFKQEKELMREKIMVALRIAVWYGHSDLCIGNFGLGSGFRNPPEEVAVMWRDAFMGQDSEFLGHFRDVVFAFERSEGSSTSSKKSSTKSSSSRSSSSKSSSSSSTWSSNSSDLNIFREVFKPSKIHGAFQ